MKFLRVAVFHVNASAQPLETWSDEELHVWVDVVGGQSAFTSFDMQCVPPDGCASPTIILLQNISIPVAPWRAYSRKRCH